MNVITSGSAPRMTQRAAAPPTASIVSCVAIDVERAKLEKLM